ncbi:MAG: hypothetical protein MUW57_18555 [Pseudomonas sp.]|nr:hypothetical protein [Pseudomonas sp.]
MHQVISAAYYRPGFARSACAWLMIDGIGIEQWLSTHLEWSDVVSLGLSLIWLIDEDEDALANRRIIPAEDGSSTIVPLLVCSDDMNFDCIVLVTEQVIEADTVHWRRFGRSISDKLEVGLDKMDRREQAGKLRIGGLPKRIGAVHSVVEDEARQPLRCPLKPSIA